MIEGKDFFEKIKKNNKEYLSFFKDFIKNFEKENIYHKKISYLSTVIKLDELTMDKEDFLKFKKILKNKNYQFYGKVSEVFTVIMFFVLLNRNLNDFSISEITNLLNPILYNKFGFYFEIIEINKQKYKTPKYLLNIYNNHMVQVILMDKEDSND